MPVICSAILLMALTSWKTDGAHNAGVFATMYDEIMDRQHRLSSFHAPCILQIDPRPIYTL